MRCRSMVGYGVWGILAIVAVLLFLPGQPLSQAASGLDETWKYALQVAFENRFIFGRDFIFTYGPLGFLGARVSDPDTAPIILAYDHFVLLQVGLIPLALWRMSRSVWTVACFVLVMLILGNARYYQDPAVTLFLLSTFWLYFDRSSPVLFAFLIALIDALLAFYIKVNLGLAALLQLFAVCLLPLVNRSTRMQAFLRGALALAIFVGSSYIVPVSILDYIRGALHIANGFNDAMYLDIREPHYFSWALAVLALMVGSLLLTAWNPRQLLLTTSCAGFSYLLFKQAFVRADEHIYVFFDYIVVPFALLAIFSSGWVRIIRGGALITVVAITLYLNLPSTAFIRNKVAHVYAYYQSFGRASQQQVVAKPISADLIARVGNSRIDCMPDDCSLLYQHGLRYHPRPVIQSYTAYDGFLDQVNAQYLRERGPEFILFSHGCIDYRVCLWDETQTKVALLENYQIDATYDDQFLLKRVALPRKYGQVLVAKGRIRLGERLQFEADGKLKIVRLAVNYSARGKLQRFLFQPPPLRVTVKTAQSKEEFRAVLPIANGGVLANVAVSTKDAVEFLLRGEFAKLPAVEFIRLHSNQSRGFTKYFDYEVYEVVP